MADILKTATTWLAMQLEKYVSRPVVYRRGLLTVDLEATVGRSLLKVSDTFGNVQMVWTDRDYLFTAADLILDSAVTIPQRGDVIADAGPAETVLYEILAPAGEPPWRFSDPGETMIRVHTKRIGTE